MTAPPIHCERLVKRYGDKVAVDGIDLEVRAGICFGLLGPNGAGKTTTVEMLEGLHAPTSGELRLFGSAWGAGRDQWMRERIGVQLQDTQLADKLTVREVIRLFRSFYPGGRDVAELLTLVRLEAEANQKFHTLSGGQKQRVALATALAGAPDLLFLDEPTTGLDPRARQTLWKVVEEFREGGGTIVLTTHYMDEAAMLCDEIAVMDLGRIIARGTPRSLVDSLGDVQFVEFEIGSAPEGFTPERLGQHESVRRVEQRRGRVRLTIDRDLRTLASVIEGLQSAGVVPVGLSTHQATLDDVFLHLTGKELGEA
ncbi:MAG TPA: ABC transporter ATP-binding protein [Polyangiaceae bacterium]|nr:ABC transporter ATP-binding protein [Polyangiaceae bacterium]